MLNRSYEVIAQHSARPSLRWKEWIPLMTQQLRLRNLIQIVAFNITLEERDGYTQGNSISAGQLVPSNCQKTCMSYYYTLHLTTMSAPFYTSEKLEEENPKWSEFETTVLLNQVNAAVNGIVVRLWAHQENKPDIMITVWGVYLNGLFYLGQNLCLDQSTLEQNTIIFNMQGGYFTCAQCLKEKPRNFRSTSVELNCTDVKPSYKVNALLSLQSKQQSIKKHVLAAQDLREKITVGCFTPKPNESSVLQRLLNENRPKAPKRQELIKAKQAVELAHFQVEMLTREMSRKQAQLLDRKKLRSSLSEENMDRGLELMSKYQNLHKEIERLKEWRKSYIETREMFVHTNAQLTYRRKQLIAELNQIYPIVQFTENKFSICGIHLPNSDNFNSSDDIMISVALGFVAHLVQMIAIFLQVPLRYPIIHFSSRSKIIDHVAEKIPDKDREFPLFLRGRDRLQFNYGVYLLNKNIAQLRFYCGIATRELPATLPNLLTLLLHKPGTNGFEFSHRSMSGSSLDLRSSSTNISPVGDLQTATLRRHIPSSGSRHFEKGHRTSKSVGSSELKFPLKSAVPDIQSAEDLSVGDVASLANRDTVSNNLSYSLDKGLDEYEDIKKAEVTLRPVKNASNQLSNIACQGFVGSEPILTSDIHEQLEPLVIKDEAQKRFLQKWQACGGPGHICSDDDYDVAQRHCMRDEIDYPEQVSTTITMPSLETSIPSGATHSSVSMPLHIKNYNENANDTEEKCDIGGMKSAVSVESNLVNWDCPSSSILNDDEENVQIREKTDAELPSDIPVNGEPKLQLDLQSVDGISDIFLADNVFASVASRTEALAQRNTSFNRVRSRHSGSGSFDDGHS